MISKLLRVPLNILDNVDLPFAKSPGIYTLQSLTSITQSVSTVIDNQVVPARPMGMCSILNRVKMAWKVFCGTGDVLIWPKGQ